MDWVALIISEHGLIVTSSGNIRMDEWFCYLDEQLRWIQNCIKGSMFTVNNAILYKTAIATVILFEAAKVTYVHNFFYFVWCGWEENHVLYVLLSHALSCTERKLRLYHGVNLQTDICLWKLFCFQFIYRWLSFLTGNIYIFEFQAMDRELKAKIYYVLEISQNFEIHYYCMKTNTTQRQFKKELLQLVSVSYLQLLVQRIPTKCIKQHTVRTKARRPKCYFF